jgi:hypothetical protein
VAKKASDGIDSKELESLVGRLKTIKAGRRNNYLATLLVAAVILSLVYQAMIEPRLRPDFAVSARAAVATLKSIQSVQGLLKENASVVATYVNDMKAPADFLAGVAINVDNEASQEGGCAKLLGYGITPDDIAILINASNGNDLATLVTWTHRFAISTSDTTDIAEYFSYAHAVMYPEIQHLMNAKPPSMSPAPKDPCARATDSVVASDFTHLSEKLQVAARVAKLLPNFPMSAPKLPTTGLYLKERIPADKWQQLSIFLPAEDELSNAAIMLGVYCRQNGIEYCSPDTVISLLDEQTKPDIVKSPYLPIDLGRVDALMVLGPVQSVLFFLFYVYAVRARLLSQAIERQEALIEEASSSDVFDAFTSRYRPISRSSTEEWISASALNVVLLLSLVIPVISQIFGLVLLLNYNFDSASGADSLRRLLFYYLALPLSILGLASTCAISFVVVVTRFSQTRRSRQRAGAAG